MRCVVPAFETLEDRRLLTSYYLSPTGNDAAAGTSTAAPWKTLTKVSNVALKAGDQILLQGGGTYQGMLYFDVNDKGTAAAPIQVKTYGTGKATIKNTAQPAIYALNTSGISISNIICVGPYVGQTTGLSSIPDGIAFYNTLTNNTKLPYIKLDKVGVQGFKYGAAIGGAVGTAGFKDISVTNSVFNNNLKIGLFTYGAAIGAHQNIYVSKVQAYYNTGVPFTAGTTPAEITGSGIVIGSMNTGKIERNVAYLNGSLGDGGGGIWCYDSTRLLFQYNESYQNKTAGKRDGDGFDLDRNTSYSVLQYNYSHDNDGGGFMMATKETNTTHTGNIVRYNISQNDGRKNSYGGLHVWGKVSKSEFYNNTIFISQSKTGVYPYGIRVHNTGFPANDTNGVHFRNNIIQTTGGVPLVNVTPDSLSGSVDLKFQGNAYWSTGSTFKIQYGNYTFASISTWRTNMGQEKVGTAAVGYQGDPLLTSPGTGGAIWNPDNLATLTAYKLKSTSPLIGKGLNLKTLFGIDPGTKDFWGTVVPTGAFEIGADEV